MPSGLTTLVLKRKYEYSTSTGKQPARGSPRDRVRILMPRWSIRSGPCQLFVESSENGYHHAAKVEGELEPPSGVNQARGQVHQFLHDGADAATLGLVAWRGIRTQQLILPDLTEEIVGQLSTGEDDGIGGKFP